MAKVIIFGIGRGADVAFRYLIKDSPHHICAFTVEKQYLKETKFHNLPIIDFDIIETVYPPGEYEMFVPLGFKNLNKIRQEKYMRAKQKGYAFISYVSSTIPHIENLKVGENCFILEGQTINLDVTIGNNVTIWSGNHIGDCSVIKDHNWLSSHVCISGEVIIESFCFLGNNSTISNQVTIAPLSFIGANALITKNTVEGGVYLASGAPKSPLNSNRFMGLIDFD